MQHVSTEYTLVVDFNAQMADEDAWRARMLELGLHREAFSIDPTEAGDAVLKFWEPDRPEALRILAKIDARRVSPQF